MSLLAIGFRVAAHVFDVGGMYTREMPAFAIGCIYATFYEKINELAKKYFTVGLSVSIAAFILGFLFFEPIATYAAAVIIIIISQKFTYYSSVTFFLGKICIGVYLFLHYSSIVLQSFLGHEYLWVLLNAGFIIETAAMIYAVQYAMDHLINRLGTKIFTKRADRV